MAVISVPDQAPPTVINKFLGLNEDTTGETQLVLGESNRMRNFRLTENYKLKKREGYTQLFNSLGIHDIQGMWYGKLAGSYQFLFAYNGHVWLKDTLSNLDYASIDTATYSLVDVVKTTPLNTAIAGTAGVDGFTILQNSEGNDLTEIAAVNINLLASIGKYYYHTDKTLWMVIPKGTYANIAAARIGLGQSTTYFQIGALTDARTFFFAFGTKLYLLNGSEYLSFDGTTFATVAGYVPLIATETPPAGGGNENEQINLLTGKKYQRFSGNGTATAYQVAETALTSIDAVYVDGVLKTPTTDYTVSLALGQVIPVAPANFTNGIDNIDIHWTKGTGSRTEVTGHKFAMFFGGQNDSRVFMFGNGTHRYIYTGLAAGVPSAEYLPALNYREIGSAEFVVTDIVRQYDRQLIFTNGGETHYSYYDPITLTNGNTIADFPTFPLNNAVGNIALGQAQLIGNNPFSIQNGIHEWVATNVRDERNEVYKSKRVEPSLAEQDLTTAITVDWEAKKEYWLAIANEVWIYNYRLDAWYRFELLDTITCFFIVDNELYYGTPRGQIMRFNATIRKDNGTAISCVWEMNFYDFGAEWLRKFLNRVWVSIQPGTKERVDLTWQTNDKSSTQEYLIQYNLMDFASVDFADYSFLTNSNPQPFRLKIKAKKFVYFKLILTNQSLLENATVLSINLLARTGGETK